MLLGYLEFVALLFLPGLAFMELFGVGTDLSFAERLGLAFGLSMAIDVLLLAFRTSGLLIGSQLMVGIFPVTLEVMLGASLVVFAAAVVLRRRVTFYVKPERYDLYVLGLVVAQALLVLAHFSKYPIFPQFSSVDFTQHVQITTDLQAGRVTMFPGGILYYGAHLLMGSLVALSGDIVLVATQNAMGILTIFSTSWRQPILRPKLRLHSTGVLQRRESSQFPRPISGSMCAITALRQTFSFPNRNCNFWMPRSNFTGAVL